MLNVLILQQLAGRTSAAGSPATAETFAIAGMLATAGTSAISGMLTR